MLQLQGEAAANFRPPRASHRVLHLAIIYFPELKNPIMTYVNGVVELYMFMLHNCFDLRSPLTMSAQASELPEFQKQVKQLQLNRTAVEAALERCAPKYTKA
jgi:hypothetical protein